MLTSFFSVALNNRRCNRYREDSPLSQSVAIHNDRWGIPEVFCFASMDKTSATQPDSVCVCVWAERGVLTAWIWSLKIPALHTPIHTHSGWFSFWDIGLAFPIRYLTQTHYIHYIRVCVFPLRCSAEIWRGRSMQINLSVKHPAEEKEKEETITQFNYHGNQSSSSILRGLWCVGLPFPEFPAAVFLGDGGKWV